MTLHNIIREYKNFNWKQRKNGRTNDKNTVHIAYNTHRQYISTIYIHTDKGRYKHTYIQAIERMHINTNTYRHIYSMYIVYAQDLDKNIIIIKENQLITNHDCSKRGKQTLKHQHSYVNLSHVGRKQHLE